MRGDAGVGMLVYAIEVTMEWRGAVFLGGKPERKGAGIRGLARHGHGSGLVRHGCGVGYAVHGKFSYLTKLKQ